MASALREPIYVVDGTRTPFLKAKNAPGPFSASDLAVAAGRALLARQPVDPKALDEVILGCANPSPDEVNIGRYVAMRLGCGDKVTGWTVMRNCASGMQALDSAINNMLAGRSEIVLAGGVDALSRAPLLYSEKMVLWFAALASARTMGQKVGTFAKLSPAALLSPVIALMKGLTDPKVGLLMGQTAENIAFRFGVTRAEMDAFAAESHKRVLAAQAEGRVITTIEGLTPKGADLHPVQAAFKANHGLQCGFCTPGMVMTAVDMIRRHPGGLDEKTIRAELEGNICRCTGYHNIVKAIEAASQAMGQREAAE